MDSMFKHYKKIPIDETYNLFIFENEFLPQVSEFVAQVYYNKKYYHFDCGLDDLIDQMKGLDKASSEAMLLYLVIDSEEQICCTARLLRKLDANVQLPIESEFEIDLNLFDAENIYEFARFASNGKITFYAIQKMLQQMIYTINIENSLVFASIDRRVYNSFVRLGYPIYKIGKTSFYMGTETLPVGIKMTELDKI